MPFAHATWRCRSVPIAIVGAWLLLGCAPIRVHVDYDPAVEFSGYRSFGWLTPPAATGQARADDPALHETIRAAITDQLVSQGFAASADAQLGVGYHVSIDKHLAIKTVSAPYAQPTWRNRDAEVRGRSETVVSEYERGTLVIDIVDTARGTLIWRGVGERRLRREPTTEQMTKSVHQAVEEILGRFPPGVAER